MVPIATVMMLQYLCGRYSEEAVSVSQKLKYLSQLSTCNCKRGGEHSLWLKFKVFTMIGSSGILECLGYAKNVKRTQVFRIMVAKLPLCIVLKVEYSLINF